MFWESSMDGVGDKSIIQNMAGVLGGKDGLGLDKTPNQLLYPNSTYDNLLKSLLEISTTVASSSTQVSTSESTIITSGLAASPECTVGPALFACPGGICTCGLNASNQPVCYDLVGDAYDTQCSGATPDCGANRTCVAGRCAPRLIGCLDSPLTELILQPVATST